MSDQTFLYWGMVVTMFLLIAAMITARDLFESYMEKREAPNSSGDQSGPTNDRR